MNSYRINHPAHRARPQGLRREVLTWWYGLPAELRSTRFFAALSCLTILALLMGFHQVVQSAVKQGELLRMSAATRAQAEWRCHQLQGERMRASCMKQLDQPPAVMADAPPINTAALQIAQR